MRNLKLSKAGILGISALALSGLSASHAIASQGSVDASISVIQSVGILGADDVDFGVIVKPTSGTAVWNLVPAGLSFSMTETGGSDSYQHPSSAPALGTFNIIAESGYLVTMQTDVTTDFSADGLSLSVRPADHLTGGASFTANGMMATVKVGGELSVSSTAASGVNSGGSAAVIQMTANY